MTDQEEKDICDTTNSDSSKNMLVNMEAMDIEKQKEIWRRKQQEIRVSRKDLDLCNSIFFCNNKLFTIMMFLSHFGYFAFQSQVSTVDDRDWEASSELLVGGLDISFIGTFTYQAFTNPL